MILKQKSDSWKNFCATENKKFGHTFTVARDKCNINASLQRVRLSQLPLDSTYIDIQKTLINTHFEVVTEITPDITSHTSHYFSLLIIIWSRFIFTNNNKQLPQKSISRN